jgi:RNA polymerase sigma-70 factor (ECF subfamily)
MDSLTGPQDAEASKSSETSFANPDVRFREMFDRDYAYVWHSLRRLGVAERDVDDVANEVFVRVHASFHAYDPSRPSRPWLFAFCARLASDYRRLARHRFESPLDVGGALESTRARSEELVALGEKRSLVLEALEALDDDRREVFVLHEIDELAIPEVARVLQIPVPTAYTRLRAARKTFSEVVRRLAATKAPRRAGS